MSSKIKVILANGEVIDDSIEANKGHELSEVAMPGAEQPDLPVTAQFPEKVKKGAVDG